MSEKLYCEECGAYLGGTTTHIFDERVMCADCFHRLTTVCDCCSDRIWCSDAEGNDHITLCHYCYDNQFTTCESCGLLIRTDEAHYDDSDYPYCDACYREYKDRPIKVLILIGIIIVGMIILMKCIVGFGTKKVRVELKKRLMMENWIKDFQKMK